VLTVDLRRKLTNHNFSFRKSSRSQPNMPKRPTSKFSPRRTVQESSEDEDDLLQPRPSTSRGLTSSSFHRQLPNYAYDSDSLSEDEVRPHFGASKKSGVVRKREDTPTPPSSPPLKRRKHSTERPDPTNEGQEPILIWGMVCKGRMKTKPPN